MHVVNYETKFIDVTHTPKKRKTYTMMSWQFLEMQYITQKFWALIMLAVP